MISILIPIYNQDVTKLIKELADQANRAKIPFEILAFDDASREKFKLANRKVNHLFGVNYLESEKNLGRAIMRNRLAKTASMPYLLFLDCDVKIPKRSFIKRYAEAIDADYPVVNGGISYAKRKPGKTKRLHWLYGHKREALSSEKRQRRPYHHIMTGNLLIQRKTYLSLRLDEDLKGYGHEDTLFGKMLKDENIPVLQIDNPVLHLGLVKNTTFLKKQEEALLNLYRIKQRYPDFETRLTRAYDKLVETMLGKWILQRIGKKRDKIVENLLSPNPSLFRLDLYKLDQWNELVQRKDKIEVNKI